MKEIILNQPESDVIFLGSVDPDRHPVFAKKDGVLQGLVVQDDKKGWMLSIGGRYGSYGYRDTFQECIEVGMSRGYTFFMEEESVI